MKHIILIPMLAWAGMLLAQHQELNEEPTIYNGNNVRIADSSSFLKAFKKGSFQGHFRYFFMNTINEGALTDYFANAIGGGLKYESAIYRNFQFGVSGFYVFNIGSSNLSEVDSITGVANRYEIGLFDIENPNNHKDIDRLEELYLNYHWKKGHISFGRQLVNSPFINLQDGRMRPTGVEGVTFDHYFAKNYRLQAAYLYAFSPRSTTKWYDADESIGLYPQGVNIDGSKGNYGGHLESNFAAYIDYQMKLGKSWSLQAHNLWIDQILNSAFLQVNWKHVFSDSRIFELAGQTVRQDAIGHGGNEDQQKTYAAANSHAMTFGAKGEWKEKKSTFTLAYNHITKAGRYLMPREWGRDPFFTFLPRERSEGLGNVHSIAVKYQRVFPKARLKMSIALAHHSLPDVKNYALNKYGMPSYYQSNLDLRYRFAKKLEGLELQTLLAVKINDGGTYDNKRYIIHKTNMLLLNVVLNYHF